MIPFAYNVIQRLRSDIMHRHWDDEPEPWISIILLSIVIIIIMFSELL